MKTNLEELSPVKKKLHIEVDSQEVQKKIDESYRKLGKRAKIPGFRPGKVPRRILETYFGTQVEEDVTRDLINETFPKAIEESQAFPLGAPLLEKEPLKQGQNFKYSAVLETRPLFEVKDYLGLEVEREIYTVTDEDVHQQLGQIREANGKLDPLPEDHPVKADDFVVLDYEGFEGDRAMDGIQASNFLLKVGSNRFHPEFEKSLVGLKKGDEADISVDFEDDYHHNSLAGKKVRFKVKLLDVKEMVLPDLDDAFAQGISKDFKTLDDLKSKLRESLGDQEEKRIDRAVKQHLMEKISEGVQIELPHTLVESEVAYAVENVKQNLQRSGSSIEKAGLSEQKLREEFRPAAEKRVKEMLILGEIANQEGLSVDEQDLAEGFEELAANTGQDAETLRKYYEARGMLDSLKENLLEQKTLNYLVEHAKISEVDKALANNQKPSEKQEGDQ